MKFIQVKEGESIAVDSIRMIKSFDSMSSRIYTPNDIYEVNIPYVTLMNMLESKEDDGLLQKMYNIMKQQGVTAP